MSFDPDKISMMANAVSKVLKSFRSDGGFQDDYNVIVMCIHLATRTAGVSLGVPRDKWSDISSDMLDALSDMINGLSDKISELDH